MDKANIKGTKLITKSVEIIFKDKYHCVMDFAYYDDKTFSFSMLDNINFNEIIEKLT